MAVSAGMKPAAQNRRKWNVPDRDDAQQQEANVKKPPPTPDMNENAPRPQRISSDGTDRLVPDDRRLSTPDDRDRSTAAEQSGMPADTATSFDRSRAVRDQESRAGQLPGTDESTAPEDISSPQGDMDLAEGVDPEPYREFWAERQDFPQQDNPDLETELDRMADDQTLGMADEVAEDPALNKAGDLPGDADSSDAPGRDGARADSSGSARKG